MARMDVKPLTLIIITTTPPLICETANQKVNAPTLPTVPLLIDKKLLSNNIETAFTINLP